MNKTLKEFFLFITVFVVVSSLASWLLFGDANIIQSLVAAIISYGFLQLFYKKPPNKNDKE